MLHLFVRRGIEYIITRNELSLCLNHVSSLGAGDLFSSVAALTKWYLIGSPVFRVVKVAANNNYPSNARKRSERGHFLWKRGERSHVLVQRELRLAYFRFAYGLSLGL